MASTSTSELEKRVAALEEQLANVTIIKVGRPPVITECVKGNFPGHCEESSVHRYQQGCHGLDCWAKNADYYNKQRNGKAAEKTEPAKPKRTAAKKKTAPQPEPSKAEDPKPKRKRLSRPELRARREAQAREAAANGLD